MSLSIIKKNSSSPFHLQRSMVNQGEGGAYESGGYNPDMVYNNDIANKTIESFGKVVGTALEASGKNKEKNKKFVKPNPNANPNADIITWEDQKNKVQINEQKKEDEALFINKYNASKKINKI